MIGRFLVLLAIISSVVYATADHLRDRDHQDDKPARGQEREHDHDHDHGDHDHGDHDHDHDHWDHDSERYEKREAFLNKYFAIDNLYPLPSDIGQLFGALYAPNGNLTFNGVVYQGPAGVASFFSTFPVERVQSNNVTDMIKRFVEPPHRNAFYVEYYEVFTLRSGLVVPGLRQHAAFFKLDKTWELIEEARIWVDTEPVYAFLAAQGGGSK